MASGRRGISRQERIEVLEGDTRRIAGQIRIARQTRSASPLQGKGRVDTRIGDPGLTLRSRTTHRSDMPSDGMFMQRGVWSCMRIPIP